MASIKDIQNILAELATAQKRREQREEAYLQRREQERAEERAERRAEWAAERKRQEAADKRREAADKRREAAEKRREQREEEAYKRREQREEEAYKRREAADKRREAADKRREQREEEAYKRQEEAYKRRQQQEEAYLQRREQALVKGEKQNDEIKAVVQEFVQTGNKIAGDWGNNLGAASEEYFYRCLENDMQLQDISFDSIERNVKKRGKERKLICEFDILLFNSNCVAIIEVKHRATSQAAELEALAMQKVHGFREGYPAYAKHQVYFGMASMVTNNRMIQAAEKLGIFLLTQRGDVLVVQGNVEPMT